MHRPFAHASLLALAIVLLAPFSASARPHHAGVAKSGGPLTGRVVSGPDRGLAGTRVIIKATAGHSGHLLERSHRTNRRGQFKFRHVAPARYAITAIKPGFYPKTIFTTPDHRRGLVIHLAHPAGVAYEPRGGDSLATGRHRGGTAVHTETVVDGRRHGKGKEEHPAPEHLVVPRLPLHLPHINGHLSHAPIAKPEGPKTPKASGPKKK